MRRAKLVAFWGLALLIAAVFTTAFHHHADFEDHRVGCLICIIATNLFPVAGLPIVFLILFFHFYSALFFPEIKPNPSRLFSVSGRAPPNSFPA